MTVDANGIRTLTSTGCPGHDWSSQSTPNSALKTPATYRMPTQVVMAASPTYLGLSQGNPMMGDVGVALDGVSIYSPSDAETNEDGGVGRSAIVFEGSSLGECGGHATAAGGYHYHAMPGVQPQNCVFDASLPQTPPSGNFPQTLCGEVIEGAVCADFLGSGTYAWYSPAKQTPAMAFGSSMGFARMHSLLVGFMADGIPLYGFHGSDGLVPNNLDECNGHASDLGFYHYHATTTYPYTAECLMGCLHQSSGWSTQLNGQSCTPASPAVTHDYADLMSSWTFPSTSNDATISAVSSVTVSSTSTSTTTTSTTTTTTATTTPPQRQLRSVSTIASIAPAAASTYAAAAATTTPPVGA